MNIFIDSSKINSLIFEEFTKQNNNRNHYFVLLKLALNKLVHRKIVQNIYLRYIKQEVNLVLHNMVYDFN